MSTSQPMRPYTPAQRSEAADWFVLIREAEDPSAETLQSWLRWLEAAPGNKHAFEAVEQAWHQTMSSLPLTLPTTEELQQDSYDGTTTIDEWLSSSTGSRVPAANVSTALGTSAPPVGAAREPPLHDSGYSARIAGATAERRAYAGWMGVLMKTKHPLLFTAAAMIGWILLAEPLLGVLNHPAAPFSNEFATKTGEHLEIALIDGSRVSLGAKSRLVVGFTRKQRDIKLESGEAFFAVQKDKNRPFVVHALNGTITAVGTAFNVRTVDDKVTVAVTEGAVKVAETEPTPENKENSLPNHPQRITMTTNEQRVRSGQQITYGSKIPAAALTVVANPDVRERPRWREGWLVYRNEPLQAVIDDISRYTDRQIEVKDDRAAALRFSGAVYKTDIDEWLHALPESFPVAVDKDDTHLIIKTR